MRVKCWCSIDFDQPESSNPADEEYHKNDLRIKNSHHWKISSAIYRDDGKNVQVLYVITKLRQEIAYRMA